MGYREAKEEEFQERIKRSKKIEKLHKIAKQKYPEIYELIFEYGQMPHISK